MVRLDTSPRRPCLTAERRQRHATPEEHFQPIEARDKARSPLPHGAPRAQVVRRVRRVARS